MIEISTRAERILLRLRNNYVDYKTQQEYGRSAFWYWYDQISQNIQRLSTANLKEGIYQSYTMQYWGDIIYSYTTTSDGNGICIIEDFHFNSSNFFNWLNHQPLSNSGFNNTPSNNGVSSKGWTVLKHCSNGFDIVFKENEYLHTCYNYMYKGNIVFTNRNDKPCEFNKVSDFTKHNGVWTARASIGNNMYSLRADGTISTLYNPYEIRKNRTAPKAETNFYRRYGLGDSVIRRNKLISEIVRKVLREEIQRQTKSVI